MGADAGAPTLTRPDRRPGYASLDEDDVRVRPGRGSRPRTRRRPAHEDAAQAFVTAVDRGRYRCELPGDRPAGQVVTAMKARELGRRSVVVGDTVSLAGDVTGAPGTLARIVRVAPRRSVLRRSADDTDPVERVIVANAEQLVIVCALANPPPRARLIDRFLVAAYDAGLAPLLCLTKSDLAAPDELLAAYAPLGVGYVVTGRPLTEAMLGGLAQRLADRVSVLVGHSGVGKSTLVNALIPDADRAVGAVSPVTGRGRHTSSSAVALRLRGGGWIIDTPGLRSFGLGHIAADRVVRAFPDLAEGVARCPPGCSHLAAGCGLDEWVATRGNDPALAARLDSLRRLLRSREGLDPAADAPSGEVPDPADGGQLPGLDQG
jgi:ribosome biogenesis GTPase